MHSIRLSDVVVLFTVALCHDSKGPWWSNATQRRWEYLEEWLVAGYPLKRSQSPRT